MLFRVILFIGVIILFKKHDKNIVLTIYDDETIIRDYVPCYREIDGEIGFIAKNITEDIFNANIEKLNSAISVIRILEA